MPNIDTRLLAYLIWGVGTLVVYSIVLWKRRRSYTRHRDARARRDVAEGIALWLVALAAAVAVTFVLFGEAGTGIRGWSAAVALGAFTACGAIMATERGQEDSVKHPVERR